MTNWILLEQFSNRVVPIRMTGGSAETHWTTKARAKRQVNKRLFHLGGRREGGERISSARQSSTVPFALLLLLPGPKDDEDDDGRDHFHFSRFLTDAAAMALNSSSSSPYSSSPAAPLFVLSVLIAVSFQFDSEPTGQERRRETMVARALYRLPRTTDTVPPPDHGRTSK